MFEKQIQDLIIKCKPLQRVTLLQYIAPCDVANNKVMAIILVVQPKIFGVGYLPSPPGTAAPPAG